MLILTALVSVTRIYTNIAMIDSFVLAEATPGISFQDLQRTLAE
jgi:hypothetical protein